MYPSIFAREVKGKSLSYNESRHNGCKLYWARPIGYDWTELEAWCREMFGPPSSLWDPGIGLWYMNSGRFFFRKEEDRTLFALKWE